MTRQFTSDPEAYQLYLKGRYYWNKRTGDDVQKSIDYLQRAIARDRNYALAYAALADSYHVLWAYSNVSFSEAQLKAKTAALKALELDDSLAEAHAALAGVKADEDWDFPGAEAEFKRAIELDPNYATARQWYAQFLSPLGRHEEALAQIKKAQESDPLSLIINAVLGDTLLRARQDDRAIEQLKKTIDMDRNFPPAHQYLVHAYIEKGMYTEAIAESQTAAVLSRKQDPQKASARADALKHALSTGGPAGYWQTQLKLANEDLKTQRVSPYFIAGIYARMGDSDHCFQWLETALKERDADLVYLGIDPEFDRFRSDSRMNGLMKRIGLTG